MRVSWNRVVCTFSGLTWHTHRTVDWGYKILICYSLWSYKNAPKTFWLLDDCRFRRKIEIQVSLAETVGNFFDGLSLFALQWCISFSWFLDHVKKKKKKNFGSKSGKIPSKLVSLEVEDDMRKSSQLACDSACWTRSITMEADVCC